jgi:S-adenosylhomocysteine hydrolase
VSTPKSLMPVLDGQVPAMLRHAGLDGIRVALSDPDVVGADALAAVLGNAGVRLVTMESSRAMVIETGPSLPDHAPDTTGVVSTTAGTAERLRSGGVSFPVLACHDAHCVRLADHQRGRRIVQAVARLTNKRIAGSRVTVTGYGATARALAATARSLGATIGVIEADPVAALSARLDGHDLTGRPTGMVMVVDGCPPPPLDDLAPGTIVVTPDSPAPDNGTEVRPGVWSVRSGEVHVVVPIVERTFDEADLVLSIAALALARLASSTHEPGVSALPADIDTTVARFALGVLG